MKISLITFSRAKNYGGILQAYALYKFLEGEEHEVQFIDYILERSNIYKPDIFVKNATSHSRIWGKGALMRSIWVKIYFKDIKSDYLKFSQFIENECKFSKRYFSYQEIVEDPPTADVYMVGSDQVWNSDYAPGKQLELPFYLPFVKGKKVSYASSFGNASIPDAHKPEVKKMLSQFAHLSVREESGKRILNELGLESAVMLDPTMLFGKEFWLRKCSARMLDKPYLLFYQVRFDPQVYETAVALAKKLGLNIVVLSMNRTDRSKYGTSVIMTPDVEQWLSYIKHARLVYSDSFHATVFSLIFHTPFIVNSASRKNMASRITNLLHLVQLERCEMVDFDVDEGYQKACQEINWNKVDFLIQKERERSIAWLKNALES